MMGIPGLPKGLDDIGAKIDEFLTLLRAVNTKLDTLIELERTELNITNVTNGGRQ